jgi:hypothetical protein
MHDDIEIEAIKAMLKEEANLRRISMSFKKKEEFKKVAIAMNYKETLANFPETVEFLKVLIEESYAADDIYEKKAVQDKIKNFSNLEELNKVVTAYRAVNGKGLEYSAWQWLQECKKNVVRRDAGSVDKTVAANISKLNKGEIKLEQLSDDQVVEMYQAALKYRKTLPAYNISSTVYTTFVVRASKLTGTKSA